MTHSSLEAEKFNKSILYKNMGREIAQKWSAPGPATGRAAYTVRLREARGRNSYQSPKRGVCKEPLTTWRPQLC